MKKKLLAGALAVLSTGVFCFSALAQDNAPIPVVTAPKDITESYASLVDAGVITAETAAEMAAFWEAQRVQFSVEKQPEPPTADEKDASLSRVHPYTQMVEQGIITTAQLEQIEAFYREQTETLQQEQIRQRTQRYVEENILPPETAALVAQAWSEEDAVSLPIVFLYHLGNTRPDKTPFDAEPGLLAADRPPAPPESAAAGPGQTRRVHARQRADEGALPEDTELSPPINVRQRIDPEDSSSKNKTGAYDFLVEKGLITVAQAESMQASDLAYQEKHFQQRREITDAIKLQADQPNTVTPTVEMTAQ